MDENESYSWSTSLVAGRKGSISFVGGWMMDAQASPFVRRLCLPSEVRVVGRCTKHNFFRETHFSFWYPSPSRTPNWVGWFIPSLHAVGSTATSRTSTNLPRIPQVVHDHLRKRRTRLETLISPRTSCELAFEPAATQRIPNGRRGRNRCTYSERPFVTKRATSSVYDLFGKNQQSTSGPVKMIHLLKVGRRWVVDKPILPQRPPAIL